MNDIKSYYLRYLKRQKKKKNCFIDTRETITNAFYEINTSKYSQPNIHESFEYVFNKLTERETYAIQYYFGFIDGNIHTLEEVGTTLNVGRERARQIISKGIRILRNPRNSKKLKQYLESIDTDNENVIYTTLHNRIQTLQCNQSVLQITNLV